MCSCWRDYVLVWGEPQMVQPLSFVLIRTQVFGCLTEVDPSYPNPCLPRCPPFTCVITDSLPRMKAGPGISQ